MKVSQDNLWVFWLNFKGLNETRNAFKPALEV